VRCSYVKGKALGHICISEGKCISPKNLNIEEIMEMSFFAWNMGMSFFGMPLYILDICPENQDESNGNSIVKLWLQFIPIFGALHSQLHKGHTTKKDIPMFLICIASPQKGI
jgi:hypothetical protein